MRVPAYPWISKNKCSLGYWQPLKYMYTPNRCRGKRRNIRPLTHALALGLNWRVSTEGSCKGLFYCLHTAVLRTIVRACMGGAEENTDPRCDPHLWLEKSKRINSAVTCYTYPPWMHPQMQGRRIGSPIVDLKTRQCALIKSLGPPPWGGRVNG